MSTDLGPVLLKLARGAIGGRLGLEPAAVPQEPALSEPGATFVTLTRDRNLRGCLGSLEAKRPLELDVRENAVGAAFLDPRFPPLAMEEYETIRVEVSLLSPMEPIHWGTREDAIARLRPFVDGVVFQHGHHRSTFLPQVWENLPDPEQFLEQLKRKAGLPPGFWHPGVKLFRYSVSKFKEADLEESLP